MIDEDQPPRRSDDGHPSGNLAATTPLHDSLNFLDANDMRCLLLIISLVLLVLKPVCGSAQSISVEPASETGLYTVADWKTDWPNCAYENGVTEKRLSVVLRDGSKRFRVDYLAGQIGPGKGGAGWRYPIGKRESATLSYVVRFSPDFEWVKGGKLPGLSGGPKNVTGGRPANGRNGFSCRLMWREDGHGEAYVYHMNQEGNYGESIPFPDDFRFSTDTDYTVRMKFVMNTPNRRNGKLRVWVTPAESPREKPVVSRDDLQWRSLAGFGVDSVLFQTFYGGGNSTWMPSKQCWAEFGDVTVND